MSPPDPDATELPSSPGARLRREREAQGLSHQQAAESLNLDTMVLTHLEANDFAALGAPVFLKGHLRRYATMLGLDDEEIVSLYEHSKQSLGEPSLVPQSRLDMAPVRGKPRWPWVVGGAATFFIASALVAYLSEHGLPWVETALEEPAPQVLQEVPATTTLAPAVASTSSPAPAEGAKAAAAQPAAPAAATASIALQPGQVSLRLQFSADSWVEVFDGSGKAVLYDLGKAGTERTITATAPLSVTIGNAAAVAVAVNGRVLPALPRVQGQTLARFGIGPDGSLR
ncbi:MAG: RodZ domain-containing protein [Steroidobacteraceae bacterium]